MVIYNTKINIVIDSKYVISDRFPWPPWYFVWHYFVIGSCGLKSRLVGKLLIASFRLTSMLFQYIGACASIFIFMCIWLLCSWFTALSCSDAGMIILLPLMTVPSMIPVSSLNCQLQSMNSAKGLRHSSSRVPYVISSAVKQSDISA